MGEDGAMTLREIFHNHDRGFLEQYSRDRARTAFMGDALLCRILGTLNMYVDPKNYDMAPWLALDGYWESWITLAIGRAIQPGWTCIDVGAWCGYYSAIMANLVGADGKVFSYEPTPLHSELAERTCRANGFDGVVHSREAISSHDGQTKYLLTEGGGSRIHNSGSLDVITSTLDQHRKADFIKIDIEGGEELAWDGMQRLLTSNPLCIVVMEWDARRYADVESFADKILARFPTVREITTDGSTQVIDKQTMMHHVMRNLWLQQ